jgi:hypothetical protein
MTVRKFLPIALAIFSIATAAWVQAPGQTQSDRDPDGNRVRQVPQTRGPLAAVPFALNSRTAESPLSIEIRTAGEMTQQDRDLAANAESEIQDRAKYEGLEFNQGTWTYQQLVCPALPNHVLLRFSRNNGTGDVSMFSASIPKNGEGRIRIVPILRRGYSLFSPAPINALTISAFNHIRAEEHADAAPDWVTTGLCYAALAGADSKTVSRSQNPADQGFPEGMAPVLEISGNGGATIRFMSMDPRPRQWAMTFDHKGKLIKASRSAPSMITEKAVKPDSMPGKVRLVPQSNAAVKSHRVP